MSHDLHNTWSTRRIRDLLRLELPGAWGAEPGWSGPNCFVIRATDLDDDGHIDFGSAAPRVVEAHERHRRQLRAGDIVVEGSGGAPGRPVGRVGRFAPPDEREYLCSNFFRLLRPDTSRVDPAFLAWRLVQFQRERQIWRHQQQTTGITNLKVRGYLDSTIAVPSPEEQAAIVRILDLVDAAIERTDSVITKYNHIRSGLLHDLVTDGIQGSTFAPLSSMANSRFSSVDKLSEHGELPVRLCNYTDVYKNTYILSDMPFMRATASAAEIARFGLRVGDVIITKDSETPDDIGVPAVVDSTAPDLVCGYHLALIRPDLASLDPLFLAMQLKHTRLARYFGRQANGSTRYGLSTRSIEQAPILKLPVTEQKRRSDVLREHDRAAARVAMEAQKLRAIKAGLMHDLLSGDVRVSPSHQLAETAR